MPFHQYRCRDVSEYMKDVEFNKWSAFIESLDGAHGEDALFRSRSSHFESNRGKH
jgi:hypothetical protein